MMCFGIAIAAEAAHVSLWVAVVIAESLARRGGDIWRFGVLCRFYSLYTKQSVNKPPSPKYQPGANAFNLRVSE